MDDLREAMMVARGASPVHRALRSRVGALVAATVVLDLAASVVILMAERHTPETGIRSYGDALFWTSTQLLTVSSNLPDPSTAVGRIVDVGLQAWAISVVAILAGAFGAFFYQRHGEPGRNAGAAGGDAPASS
jgi:hypothetical protein